MHHVDLLLRHARVATLRADDVDGYGLIDDGTVAVAGGRILWIGRDRDLPAGAEVRAEHDLGGRLLTPGLIDCHTHLVWGGDRIDEFELRQTGVPYAEIARRGGGIVSTVRATRAASDETLLRHAGRRLDALARDGVTTVEIKSGYGLDTETEVRQLRVARRLGRARPERVVTTFLGAHAVAPDLDGDREAHIARVVDEMLPAVVAEGLADAVDAFCESIAFSVAQVEKVFAAARAAGLPVKLHAEQLSNLGGASLAARFGALSADHLEYLDDVGVGAMATAGTVAVVLPGAFYFLRETRRPPVEALRAAGVPMAVATDLNPGSSPLHSLLIAGNMASILFGLTPAEVLAGMTRHAAKALALEDDLGTLELGKRADFAMWDTDRPAALVAGLGESLCRGRWIDGARAEAEAD